VPEDGALPGAVYLECGYAEICPLLLGTEYPCRRVPRSIPEMRLDHGEPVGRAPRQPDSEWIPLRLQLPEVERAAELMQISNLSGQLVRDEGEGLHAY